MNTEYFQPQTLDEALALLQADAPPAVLAGGTDLLVERRKHPLPGGALLDIGKIEALKSIRREGDALAIGAMATYTDMERSPLLREAAPLLCQAARLVGAPQIRNRGTIGGNVANASPAADMLPVLACLDATVQLASAKNRRAVPVTEFVCGNQETLLQKDELITGFTLPVLQYQYAAFHKIGRRNALVIARLSGTCLLNMEGGRVRGARLAVGAAFNQPMRLTEIESYLEGREPTADTLDQCGEMLVETIQATTGRRASSGYKFPVARDFLGQLVRGALQREEQAV